MCKSGLNPNLFKIIYIHNVYFSFACLPTVWLWVVAVYVSITFQTEKMPGRGSELRVEHSPAIAYKPS